MLKRDYLMRSIQVFTETMMQMMKLRLEHRHDEAFALIDQTGQQLFKLNAQMISKLSSQTLIDMLDTPDDSGARLCLMLAQLIHEQAANYEAKGDLIMSAPLYLKALQIDIGMLVFRISDISEEQAAQVSSLLEKLDVLELPADTRYNLFHYFGKRGQYAHAEDTLFDLLDTDEATAPQLLEDGIAFYERLQRQSDADLIAGDLPRAEVESALQELIMRRT